MESEKKMNASKRRIRRIVIKNSVRVFILSGNGGGAGGEDAREREERERGEHEERGNGRGVAFNETAFVGFGVRGITIERGNVRRSRRGLGFLGGVCHNF